MNSLPRNYGFDRIKSIKPLRIFVCVDEYQDGRYIIVVQLDQLVPTNQHLVVNVLDDVIQ